MLKDPNLFIKNQKDLTNILISSIAIDTILVVKVLVLLIEESVLIFLLV